jgi:hypothetical protein
VEGVQERNKNGRGLHGFLLGKDRSQARELARMVLGIMGMGEAGMIFGRQLQASSI